METAQRARERDISQVDRERPARPRVGRTNIKSGLGASGAKRRASVRFAENSRVIAKHGVFARKRRRCLRKLQARNCAEITPWKDPTSVARHLNCERGVTRSFSRREEERAGKKGGEKEKVHRIF